MNFIPESREAEKVPFFEDVTGEHGWQGHSTTKSIETLETEVQSAIRRLGGLVVAFQRGKFLVDSVEREGYQIRYVLDDDSNTQTAIGEISCAALPVKTQSAQTRPSHVQKSLKMALYMLRNALNGLWFLRQLSPGFAPLLPWVLAEDGKTISQLWHESRTFEKVLPPPDSEFVEGEFSVE